MKKGYTLLEILAVSLLLSGFLIAFMEGSRVMSIATQAQQNQNEAILIARQADMNWRSGATGFPSAGAGNFINGTEYTLTTAGDSYSALASSLQKLALTISWNEPRFDSTQPRSKELKHVAFSY